MFSLCWKHFQSSDIQGGEAFLFKKKKKVLCKYLEQWPCTYVCTKILHMTQVQPSSKNVALLFCFPCFHFDKNVMKRDVEQMTCSRVSKGENKTKHCVSEGGPRPQTSGLSLLCCLPKADRA